METIDLEIVKDKLTLRTRPAVARNSVRSIPYLKFLVYTITSIRENLAIEGLRPASATWELLDDNSPLAGTKYRFQGYDHSVYRSVYKESPSEAPSDARVVQNNFRAALLEAAGAACLFTGEGRADSQASHIIASDKASKHLSPMVQGPPRTMTPVEGIMDLRNGLFVSSAVHRRLDALFFSVIAVPNPAMRVDDVNTRPNTTRTGSNRVLPPGGRFVLQRIGELEGTLMEQWASPIFDYNGLDAYFKKTNAVFPASHLLDYRYGVAAMNAWAREYQDPRPPLPPRPARQSGRMLIDADYVPTAQLRLQEIQDFVSGLWGRRQD
ncbi:hypothetical protein C8R46DRAFT_1205066 [Mycena filopes]|nr:hypothetical protein C8R46DRAFT_1205066 [Mycena filopes]